jgi:hypothetical protein
MIIMMQNTIVMYNIFPALWECVYANTNFIQNEETAI